MIPDTITAEELTSAIIRLFTDGDPVVPDAHFFGEEAGSPWRGRSCWISPGTGKRHDPGRDPRLGGAMLGVLGLGPGLPCRVRL